MATGLTTYSYKGARYNKTWLPHFVYRKVIDCIVAWQIDDKRIFVPELGIKVIKKADR